MGDNEWIVTPTLSTAVVFATICALCKRVRVADGSWEPSAQTYEHITHVFCKECANIILAT